MSEEPLTARDLCAIIRRWLEQDDPTHWGSFERELFWLLRRHEGGRIGLGRKSLAKTSAN